MPTLIRLPSKKITGFKIFLTLVIIGIIYAGYTTYNNMVIKQIQRILPEKVDRFMYSGADLILISEMVNLHWDNVCIKRTQRVNFLTFFLEKNQIATFSFDSKIFKFTEAPAEQTRLTCSGRAKAIFRKHADEFYFSEQP